MSPILELLSSGDGDFAVMLEEDGELKIATAHFSVGVPDEVAAENAVGWSEVTSSH